MNENRVNELKKLFEGLAPDPLALYTNQEIVNILLEIQKTQMQGVYEQTHAEHMRDRDLMLHISALADEYGLKETEIFKRFEMNMSNMGYTIGSFIKGMNGERIAKRALKLLSFDKNVKILYNVALEDEDAQAEYDAVVITPYGIFVVEVKNWGSQLHIDENGMLTRADQDIKYDLPGRMSVKEGLLRECIGDLFPEKYQGIVLFSNENAKVEDEYKKIPVCFGGGIVYRIREFDKGSELLTMEQIQKIADKIMSNHKEQKAPCKVKCNEIIEDYAVLMTAIEEAADGVLDSVNELRNIEQETGTLKKDKEESERDMGTTIKIPQFLMKEGVIGNQKLKNTVSKAASILVVFGVGIMAAKVLVDRR